MKKLVKIALIALTLALLIGSVFAVNSFAAASDDQAAVDAGNVWKYVDSNDAEQYAADLPTAVTNAKAGTTVTLLADQEVTATGASDSAPYVKIDKALTIDLNQKTFTMVQASKYARIGLWTTDTVLLTNGTLHAYATYDTSVAYGKASPVFFF